VSQAWIEVDQGRRRLDWAVCFGDLDDADYLTPAGRETGARAASDLEAFFGPDWLHRATNPADRALMPELAPFWPSLLKAPAYVAALGLWARLRLLTADRVQGVRKLRGSLRANPAREHFRHGTGQARLAVQASLAGARVVLEPPKPGGGPGDLLAVRGGSELFLEFRAIGPDRAFAAYNTSTQTVTTQLRMLESRLKVHWSGQLPDDPGPTWWQTIEDAAELASVSNAPVEVTTDGRTLVVKAGPAPVGTSLDGPPLESDQGPRLIRALTSKAIQTVAAGAAWIWLEDDGALWPLAAFARYALAQKVDVLTEALNPLFATYPHLLGVVLTSDTMRLTGPVVPATEQRPRGTGYLRTLPDGQVRESVVVHRALVVPEQYALVCQMCADEPAWLDGALARLGVHGGWASLTTWRPSSTGDNPGRSPSGLYLPRW
jgi:hypothetical protein